MATKQEIQSEDKEVVEASGKKTKTIAITKTQESKNTDKKASYSLAYRYLIRPLLTEKINSLSKQNKFAFEVSQDANKIEISKSFFQLYGVFPEAVNIIRIKGKTVKRGKIKGRQKDLKKAIISVKKEDKVEVYGK